jgi:hypothetical protein
MTDIAKRGRGRPRKPKPIKTPTKRGRRPMYSRAAMQRAALINTVLDELLKRYPTTSVDWRVGRAKHELERRGIFKNISKATIYTAIKHYRFRIATERAVDNLMVVLSQVTDTDIAEQVRLGRNLGQAFESLFANYGR